MSTLQLYKTLWGHEGGFEEACQQAVAAGFYGIEGQAPENSKEQKYWQELLSFYQLAFIAEITTAGSYVPNRLATVEQHVDSLQKKINDCLSLKPEFITCLAGCDAWSFEQSITFFEQGLALAKKYKINISFETHRGRSFFNPWITEKICEYLPDLKITCDFSHWCVVCERLFDMELENLQAVFKQAFHIHARVGFDQGAQVSDPTSELYKKELTQHQLWWKKIWALKLAKGETTITMTPEFGPDGYQTINPQTKKPMGDLWAINCWMAQQQKNEFEAYIKEKNL